MAESRSEDLDSLLPEKPGFRSGYVTLVGRPNVGKSTLLNTFLGQKLAIVSNKPQTTRHRILGIHTEEDCQIIFLDTPGIHKPKEALNQFMVDQALGSIADGDVILVILSGTEKIGSGDEFIVERVRQSGIPFIAVLNKIDLLKPQQLASRWEWFQKTTEGAVESFAISALKQAGTDSLLETLKKLLPEGPMFYPEDALTDRSDRFILAELIREKIIRATKEELPYASTVRIDQVKEGEGDAPTVLFATVSVERDTQKAIVIGKGGEMLKRIGVQARKEMEEYLGKHLFLEIRVEVRKNWRSNPKELQRLGYSDEVA
jgi:GTP-binding protein Era